MDYINTGKKTKNIMEIHELLCSGNITKSGYINGYDNGPLINEILHVMREILRHGKHYYFDDKWQRNNLTREGLIVFHEFAYSKNIEYKSDNLNDIIDFYENTLSAYKSSIQ